MTRVNANIFHQVLLLGSLIVLPLVVLGDAGHDAKKEPAAMEGMDHGKMKMGGQGGAMATSGHWMAPAEAARRGPESHPHSMSPPRG